MSWRIALSLATALVVSSMVSRALLSTGYARVVSGVVRAFMQHGELERCVAQPATWTPQIAKLQLFAYDPVTVDGAFSSAGAYGLYPWINETQDSGIVARQVLGATASLESADRGRAIRFAFFATRRR